MTPSDAWKIFYPELRAVTVDMWPEEEYQEHLELATTIEAGVINAVVLKEIESCLDREWCHGKIKTAALTVLAANGGLEEFNPDSTWSRRPRTKMLLGKRWIVG